MDLHTILSTDLLDDTISPAAASEIIMFQKQYRLIRSKYKDKIKHRKDGRQVYVLINRKMISSSTEDGLYQKLWELEYGRSKASLQDLYPEWMIWKRDNTAVSSKTLKEYTFLWNSVLADTDIVKKPITDLSAQDFMEFFRSTTRGRDLTKKRFCNIKSLINGIYSYAIEQGIVNANPIRDLDCGQLPFKPVNRQNDVFSVQDRTMLLQYLDSMDNDIYALAIQLDFCLVARIGELLALKWCDIEDDFIHIQGQRVLTNDMHDDLSFSSRQFVNVDHVKGYTDKGFRYQPLSAKAQSTLAKIRQINPDGEFILMHNGHQLLTDTFNDKLKRYCKDIGITPKSSHKIRFCTASILYSQGMPLADLQAMLGHTTAAMTLHYIRQVIPDDTSVQIVRNTLN